MMFLVWRALGRAARQPDPFAGGMRLAFLAIVITGMYHHVFLSFPVAWILWVGIGLALRPDRLVPRPERLPRARAAETAGSNIADFGPAPALDAS
jgi:hypothetical protein